MNSQLSIGSPEPSTTRSSLIQRVRAGKEEAWTEFYNKYTAMIWKMGARHNLSGAECDDLMVEVMLIFWKKMQNFFYDPSKGKLRNFLRRIAFFVSLKIREKNYGDDDDNALADYPVEVDESVMEEWREFILKEALEELKANVDSEVFQVFQMSFIEKRPIQDICAITRRSANSVYVIRSRCLKKLRNIIDDYRHLEESELRCRSNKNASE